MIEILLFFIAASVLLYVVLGGADYGAGILELVPIPYLQNKQRHVVNEAMGPVWEANHMWLILVVVILFVGFPGIFNIVMIHLHIPVVALLVGIVARGTAFTFRHYDAIHEPKSQNVYSLIFSLSSLWTTFWLGVLAGSLFQGRIDPTAKDFVNAYVAPWTGFVPFTMGIFTICICTFLASVYLVGETQDSELKKYFWRRGFAYNIAVIITGGLVFLAAYLEDSAFLKEFLNHPLSIACVVAATLLFFLLWQLLKRNQPLLVRLTAAAQVSLIILGWYFAMAPAALSTPQGPVSFYDAAAPAAALRQLTYALCVGSVLIFPSLFYLLKVFKLSSKSLQSDSAKNDGK
ncbi:cytochrome d ubiquinol oxidase subunit II [Bdellovibrio sp. SKB1291214]|uniref:cytochrome d ubiquinol oxidase subunit II n=1 Tax=Bdellovibrio sp. SKB1291214 TaxID=1732569 RepID=UPI000B51B90B|nr:cytochrome d ubiquinol oxidase subunit II [Bdellovibrio sp. SKB1291214]UYL07344.1 cytochrome d ubiquinol oxidase subunit II [Bdellovibrio sp. SKB1291214]